MNEMKTSLSLLKTEQIVPIGSPEMKVTELRNWHRTGGFYNDESENEQALCAFSHVVIQVSWVLLDCAC